MSDRHERWERVEPPLMVKAGQPYRMEYPEDLDYQAMEKVAKTDHEVWTGPACTGLFVDSSWHPPVVLPTEPTWGIAVNNTGTVVTVGKWHTDPKFGFKNEEPWHYWPIERVGDFIPLTEEQVQRIENAR